MGQQIRYIENPERGIFLIGEIELNAGHRHGPSIVRLRQSSRDPICLYIDSNGGYVHIAERLLNLIKAPTQSDEVPWLITVAYGQAASAAANLLTLGDYAIVYPTATIHYHGSRQNSEICLDNISVVANSLRETNERLATRIASRMFKRMVFLAITIGVTSNREQELPGEMFSLAKSVTTPQSFFADLRNKVSVRTQALFDSAMSRQARLDQLVKYVEGQGFNKVSGTASIEQDASLLKSIVEFEATKIKEARKGEKIQVITYEDTEMIKADYRELFDYFFGDFRSELKTMIDSNGFSFLLQSERAKYNEIKDKEEQADYLREKVEPRLEPLWYLVVSLCRCLQEGENPLTPEDAIG